MLSAGNPYVLPSVLVAAVAYLAATLLTDASLLVRIGVLALLAGVVPIVLNRLLGGGSASGRIDEPIESPGDGDVDADESREA
ncbi:hypothetical protein [Halorubrum sp. CSM-61]|uniref:hypothetical protein n=1 Tax=Halorubrum sp. CSM-61 TaxID=2485838 RepID=UPI000F4B8457|nr:hypothetical protein [Halorubrum sp. CSM-61]